MARLGRTALALLWLGGCTSGPSDLFLDLRTDMAPGVEFDLVRVTVGETTVEHRPDSARVYVDGVRIAELLALEPGSHRADVSLLLAEEVVAARPVVVTLDGPQVVTVVMTRDCRGVACPVPGGDATAAACVGATCVDATCTAESSEGCGEAECDADADCTAAAGACSSARCVAGACLYGDDGTCPTGEFCTVDDGCRPVPDGPAELAVDNLGALFSTPNTVRWAWEPAGDNRDLRHYRLELGTDAASLDTVIEPDDNPELAGDIWFRPDGTVRTTSFAMQAGETYFARIVGVDWFGREAASDVAMVTTPPSGANAVVVFADDETAGYSIPSSVTRSDADPFMGTHAYDMLNMCDPGEHECFEITRRQEIDVDVSAIDAAVFDAAYVEFSVQVDTPDAHSRYSSVRLMTGVSGDNALFNYEGFTIAGTGAYRTYQVPLSRFGQDIAITPADLANGLREFGVGGSWAHGATVRWDEVRIFY